MRPARSAVIVTPLGIKVRYFVGVAADAARYAVSRSKAHAIESDDWLWNDPVPRMALPPIEVPGETPTLPVAMVVTVPSNVMAVPASTAKLAQLPRGMLTAPLANAASTAITMVKDDRKYGAMMRVVAADVSMMN